MTTYGDDTFFIRSV